MRAVIVVNCSVLLFLISSFQFSYSRDGRSADLFLMVLMAGLLVFHSVLLSPHLRERAESRGHLLWLSAAGVVFAAFLGSLVFLGLVSGGAPGYAFVVFGGGFSLFVWGTLLVLLGLRRRLVARRPRA